MRRGNFTMLKDATGIRWFSSPRSRIPIINPESVKLVGISLEIADLAIVLPTIFSSCTLPSHGILPQLYVHTFIYIYSSMLSNDNNNWNNREQFSPDSVLHLQRASKFAFSYTGASLLLCTVCSHSYLFTLSSRIIIIEISCNLNNFNLSLEIDRRGVDAQQGIILDNKLIILGEKARGYFFESSPPSMYRVGNWKR